MAEDLTAAGDRRRGRPAASGEIIAVGTRPAGGGRIELAEPPQPGEPTMRWLSHGADDRRASRRSWPGSGRSRT